MTIPTEPIGSIPRPLRLIEAVAATDGADPALDPLYEEAIRDTIARFEATGSPVITDGEQRKYHNFWTYCVQGLPNTAPDGFKIPFSAGHVRRMLRLTGGPFRYKTHADCYLDVALKYAHRPVKQAVISPSALSLMYPRARDPRLLPRPVHRRPARRARDRGPRLPAEGRALRADRLHRGPAGGQDRPLRRAARQLHRPEQPGADAVLRRRAATPRRAHLPRLATATRPTAARSITPLLLPSLFELKVGNFYVALAGEKDRARVLGIVREHLKPGQRVFVGVINPIDPRVETPEEVRDRVLEAARYIPVEQLGHLRRLRVLAVLRRHDDEPGDGVCQDPARVEGTALAAEILGGG